MKRNGFSLTAASTLALLSAGPALAQQNGADDVQVLSTWSYDPIYADGWSVENMFAATDVLGEGGEVIGDIENVIFSNDGKVLGVIAEVGGFWDIGDTHVNVPWDEVDVGDSIENVSVPVTEDNIDDYDVFGDYWGSEEVIGEDEVATTQPVDDDLVAGAGIFKATDLVGDYAYLADGDRYGYVSDIIVQDGSIAAIVMDATTYGRPGYYAYPYANRRGYTPGPRYDVPYEAAEIDTIENFDYSRLQSRVVE